MRIADILGELARRARAHDDPLRAVLLEGIAETSGLHPTSLQRLTDLWADAWMPPGPKQALQRGLGHLPPGSWSPLDQVAVVAPGNLCVATWQAVLEPLLAGCRVRLRSASGDPRAADNLARALGMIDSELAERLETTAFDHRDDDAWCRFLAGTQALAIYGGDEAVAAVLKQAAFNGYQGRVRCHGHMQSLAVLQTAELDRPGLVQALAHDALLADGRGCMSLRLVLLVGMLTRQQQWAFHQALAEALAEAALVLPAGTIAPQWLAQQALEGDAFAFAAALSPESIDLTRGSDWWLASDWRSPAADGPPLPDHPELGPGGRGLIVRRVGDWSALTRALAPWRTHLSSAALHAPGQREEALRALNQLGVHRVCAPGQLQAPPADRAPDGHEPLIDFVCVAGR